MTSPAENPVMKEGLSVEPSPTATPEAMTEATASDQREHEDTLAYKLGFWDGFMASAEGWNGEYPRTAHQTAWLDARSSAYARDRIRSERVAASSTAESREFDAEMVALAAGQALSEGTRDGSSPLNLLSPQTQEGSAQPLTVLALKSILYLLREQTCSNFRYPPWEDQSRCADRAACAAHGCSLVRSALNLATPAAAPGPSGGAGPGEPLPAPDAQQGERREVIAKTLFQGFKRRAARSAGLLGRSLTPRGYAADEWENLPASFKRDFYDDAEAILASAPRSLTGEENNG